MAKKASSQLIKRLAPTASGDEVSKILSIIKPAKEEKPKEPTIVDRYKGEKEAIDDNAAFNVEKPNESNIREQYRRNAQSTVNAIQSTFDKYIQEDIAAKQKLESKAYLSGQAFGLGGSPEGAKETYQAAEKGQEQVRQTTAERDAQIAKAYADADLRASEAFQKERELYLGSAADRYKEESALNEKIKTNAMSELEKFAQARSYDTWAKEAGSGKIEQYMKETGMDENSLKAYFIMKKPAETKVYSEKIGDQHVTVFKDPITGETRVEKIELPKEPGEWTFQVIDDIPYFVDKENQTIKKMEGFTSGTDKAAAKKQEEEDEKKRYKFTNDDRGLLLNVNLKQDEIDQIEKDISLYGKEEVLKGITDEAQKKAVQKILGGSKQVDLSREAVAKFYGLDENDTTGFLGFGGGDKGKIDEIMAAIEQYRAVGYDDAKILEILQKGE